MSILTDLQKLLLLCFVGTSMLSIGLRSGITELRAVARARGFITKALLANFLLVPLLGFGLAHMLRLPPETAGALILLACVPGGLNAIHFTSKVEGEATVAETLFALMTIAAVVGSPWVVRLVLPATAGLDFPHGRALAFVVGSILVPMGAGIFFHDRSPALALKLSKILGYVSLVPFVALTILTKSFRKEAVHRIGGPAVGAMLLFIVASMAIGWLLGGPARRTRQILATVTSMRNTVVCLIIAENSPLGVAAMPPLIAFSLLMVAPNTILTIANAIWSRKERARRAGLRLEEKS